MLEGAPEYRRAIRFELGQVFITPAALMAVTEAHVTPQALLARHQTGDFGNLCAEDREANRQALRLGCRVLSQYDLSTGERVWIITEGPRHHTTILLAREY